MDIVFISGWATSGSIWNKICNFDFPVHFLEWNDVLSGKTALPSSCILVGWSLGGQLALELSSRREVKGLVLVSSMCCIASSGLRPGVDPATCSEITSMLSRSRQGYLKSFFRRCGAGMVVLPDLLAQSSLFSIEELQLGLDVMFNRVVKPDRSVPAVVIHGTSDEIIPYECSTHLIEEVLDSASFIPVEVGSHLLPLTHPEVIARAVKKLAERIHS